MIRGEGYGNLGDYDVPGEGFNNSFTDDSHRPRYSTPRNGPWAQNVSSPESSRRESSRVSAGIQDLRTHGEALDAGVQDLRTDFGPADFRGNGYGCFVTDSSHRTGHVRDDVCDSHYHDIDIDDGSRRATTDPYQIQQPQSPSRMQPQSPGSRRSPIRDQSPDSRQSSTRCNTVFALPISHGGREILMTDIPSSPDRVTRNAKRNKREGDLDPSWLLQQSHESAPDVTRMIYGRKAIRTHDGLMRDDVRDLSTQRQENARSSGLPARWVTDKFCDPQLESYRPRFIDEKTGKQG
jgi:hypothetical protein